LDSYNLPNLVVRHKNIEENDQSVWDLTPFIYIGGAKVIRTGRWHSKVQMLHLASERVKTIQTLKKHAIDLISSGYSFVSVKTYLNSLQAFIAFVDEKKLSLETTESIDQSLYDYAEYKFSLCNNKKIKMHSAYRQVGSLKVLFTGAFERVNFNIEFTGLERSLPSQRVLSRKTENVMIGDATKLSRLCFDIINNFDPKSLLSGSLPIKVKVRDEVSKELVNLTPHKKNSITINKNFENTHAAQAFNNRVSAESMIFLAMTSQNVATTYNLRIEKFGFKPIGEKYEVREFKHRRGGEVLFKIPKPYRPYFEQYLKFINEYAPNSKWLFPYLKKGSGFEKRNDRSIKSFKDICIKHKIPWTPPKYFRTINLNILMRLCSDEKTTADYANHSIATFRERYEFPSLQRAMIEVGRFWNKNDPLTHGMPKISLFNTPCNGVPKGMHGSTNKLPKPDCITPTGCIGCDHYRDEDSIDYVWNLYSFKYLKIIESNSHRSDEEKPSNIVIDWANYKINWFKKSEKSKHREWDREAGMRIDEGCYHPIWSRKIEKYER
jgi:hypothetical protein